MNVTSGLQTHVAAWGSHRRLQIARTLSYTNYNRAHSYAATPGWTLTNVDTHNNGQSMNPVGNAVPRQGHPAIACNTGQECSMRMPLVDQRVTPLN